MVERWSPKPNVEGSSPSAPVDQIKTDRIRKWFYRFYYIFTVKIVFFSGKFCYNVKAKNIAFTLKWGNQLDKKKVCKNKIVAERDEDRSGDY